MAHPFLAHGIKHNGQVAIKLPRPELSASIGTERFLREIEISAGLQHPHIVPVQLGSFEEAVEVLGQSASVEARTRVPSLHVRSFAERGALFQQLGNANKAIEMTRSSSPRKAATKQFNHLSHARDAVAAPWRSTHY